MDPPPQIMDTPRPEQVRTAQPEAPEATEGDCLELMEMILGALGRWRGEGGITREWIGLRGLAGGGRD